MYTQPILAENSGIWLQYNGPTSMPFEARNGLALQVKAGPERMASRPRQLSDDEDLRDTRQNYQ